MTIRIFDIFDTPSKRSMLSVMEASTGHLFYAAELVAVTGYSKTTVLSNLKEFHEAGVVRAIPEATVWNRASRINYELTPLVLNAVRVVSGST
jgi:hypothetical protein